MSNFDRLAETLDALVAARARIAELEALLDESRNSAGRLNRRAQEAEGIIARAGLVDGRPQKAAGRSLGRALANYAASMYERERDEASAALVAVLEGRPRADGLYTHLVHCNSSRRDPPGTPGTTCCCHIEPRRARTPATCFAALEAALAALPAGDAREHARNLLGSARRAFEGVMKGDAK